MIIIGIDPGTLKTGYGIIEANGASYRPLDYGCIVPPQKKKLTERYLIIFNALEELFERYRPEALAVETQYVDKNIQSTMKLVQVRGFTLIVAAKKRIPIYEYAPSKAKNAVVGKGQASKEQVKSMVGVLLGLNSSAMPYDASDALALAICHAHTLKYGSIIESEI